MKYRTLKRFNEAFYDIACVFQFKSSVNRYGKEAAEIATVVRTVAAAGRTLTLKALRADGCDEILVDAYTFFPKYIVPALKLDANFEIVQEKGGRARKHCIIRAENLDLIIFKISKLLRFALAEFRKVIRKPSLERRQK